MMTSMAKLARTGALRAGLVGAALLGAAACRDKAATGAADSTLSKDLALAGQQTQVPTFQDTAIAPAPAKAAVVKKQPPAPTPKPKTQPPPLPKAVVQAPAPQPAPVLQAPMPAPVPAPIPATISSGSALATTSGSKVCTSSNLPGDKIVATTSNAITGSNGAVIPAGSAVVLEVASVTPGATEEATQITFRVRSVVINDKTYNVSADVTSLAPLEKQKVAGDDPNADKKKVIGGAIVGAILGQMIGHNTKGTVIGAVAGAAGGAAMAKSGEKWEGCLPAGAPIRVTLTAPLVLTS